jgi:hypothetical protein
MVLCQHRLFESNDSSNSDIIRTDAHQIMFVDRVYESIPHRSFDTIVLVLRNAIANEWF